MDFNRIKLDKYITSIPDSSDFDGWADAAVDAMTDDFYDEHYEWVDESNLSVNWMNKLYNSGMNPKDAGKLIERAYNIHIKQK